MKKVLSLLAFAAAFWMSAKADEAKVITDEASALSASSLLTVEDLKALSNTGKHFAFVNTNTAARGWHTFGGNRAANITTGQLYEIIDGSEANLYIVKNYQGEVLTQANSTVTFSAAQDATGFDWSITQDGSSKLINGTAESLFRFRDNTNASTKNYRVEYKDFGNFSGDWAHYYAFGPFYVARLEYQVDGVTASTEDIIVTAGDMNITSAPAGYAVVGTPSITITQDATFQIPVERVPDWAGLEAIIAEAEAIPYGDHLGEYSNPSFAGELGDAQNVLSMHQNDILHAGIEQVDEAISNLRTAINNLTLNMPAAGSFIRLKGGVSNEYADANAQADQTNRAARVGMSSDATGAGSIWYLDNSKHLINFAKGYYITNTCDHSGTADNAAVFSFRESDRTIGRYGIYTSGARLYDNGAPNDRNCLDRQGSAANETENWILEEVGTLPVALTQVGELAYATFNAPVAVAVPSGVTAYSASVNGSVLELAAFEGTNLAANTPVILTATTANTYNFNIVATGTTIDDNDLLGTIAKQNVANDKTTYVLNYNSENKIGFYKSTTFINGFKAYTESTNSTPSNALSFRFEDVTTAIDAIENVNTSAEIYDLQGRRLNKAQKGMNIINGMKVLVK